MPILIFQNPALSRYEQYSSEDDNVADHQIIMSMHVEFVLVTHCSKSLSIEQTSLIHVL